MVVGMTLDTFLQQLINGLSLGSLYALIAIGYTMVYGILRLINFAHGDIFMMAAYFAYFGIAVFLLPWYVTFIVTIALTMLLGILIERVAYRPLREAPKTSLLISAIGVSFFLENLATYLFSGKPQAFPEFPLMTTPFYIGALSIQPVSILIPIIAFVLMMVLMFVINKTKVGMAMRAVAKDYDTAKLMGIKINNVISSTFGIGSGLAAVGAILWCMKYPSVLPLMGVVPGLKCFIAAVIGGIGNVKGALLGGLILGFSEVLMVAFFPALTGYRDAIAFVILIVILLFLPNGLLGQKQVEKV
ncbi:MAG: branched-chain amino acid transport system permease protein [Eubacteriaceae bacterium]|jgi:branched-chain amino acid transport system permease protein|nr:branched-chain amino acid transport system permease protein [Eubacteriaceae bacterium]MDK2961792.1 branched-chain amino acid transport system permease protein [Eubacteriaceae bacterium]MDN5306718.1 branched-chain amino acid transport system permease protein [Eubacteriaceae bacterium]